MGLSGNLESFGVPEILQLLALQRKSGVLHLVRDDDERQVLFLERGRIVATRDRREEGADPFLGFLRGANYITADQLATIDRIRSESGKDAIYVMLSGGIVGRDRLVEAITQHTQQIVDNLLHWTRGSYEFSGDERSVPKLTLKVPLNIEELLMEGMRRMDELATIKQAVLAPDLHLLRSDDPVDRGEMSRELLVVYDLVARSTPVETLVGRSPLGEYSTYEAISALLDQGALVVDPCPPPPSPDPHPAPLEVVMPVSRQPIYSTWAGVAILTLVSVAFGLASGSAFRHHSRGLFPAAVIEARHRADTALAREVYESATGYGRTGVDQLVRDGYLRPRPR